jgi:hypothetical protein
MGEWKAQLGLRERKHKHVLSRLAVDPKDAGALVALYESHEVEIRAAAVRWLGKNRELCEQAVHNILVALGRQASTYDPQSMGVAEWIQQCADTEARRLREALDAEASNGQRTRRAL